MDGNPVLVTTEKRGVFFGYLKGEPTQEKLTLTRARNCIRWCSELHGFLGLAEQGPISGCRIGPAVDELILYGITSISAVSEDAVKNWESMPWD